MKYAMVKKLRLQYSVKDLCKQLDLSESGYYSWRSRTPSRRKKDDAKLKVVIKAAHKNLFNGEIVGNALDKRMTTALVMKSLFRAVSKKRPSAGLLHHSDRGSQYCSKKYWSLLNQFKMKVSMSRKGNCYDNAPIESFWGILKNELVYHHTYETSEQAIRDITEYIEIFYNRQRRQKRLGYLSPAAYEKKYYEKLIAA